MANFVCWWIPGRRVSKGWSSGGEVGCGGWADQIGLSVAAFVNCGATERLELIRNLWVCTRVRAWLRARPTAAKHVCWMCHHELIIFLLSHRSAACHHHQLPGVWAQLQFCHIAIHSLSCFHRKATQLRGARLGELKASAPSIYLAPTLLRMILVLSPHDVSSCFSFPWLYEEITV